MENLLYRYIDTNDFFFTCLIDVRLSLNDDNIFKIKIYGHQHSKNLELNKINHV